MLISSILLVGSLESARNPLRGVGWLKLVCSSTLTHFHSCWFPFLWLDVQPSGTLQWKIDEQENISESLHQQSVKSNIFDLVFQSIFSINNVILTHISLIQHQFKTQLHAVSLTKKWLLATSLQKKKKQRKKSYTQGLNILSKPLRVSCCFLKPRSDHLSIFFSNCYQCPLSYNYAVLWENKKPDSFCRAAEVH